MKLYMAVTADKYELPCVVVDTATQLAELYGLAPANLHRYIRQRNIRKKQGVMFIKVEV